MGLRERLEELHDLPHGTAELIAMEVQSTLERQEEMFAERLKAANLQQWVMAIALSAIALSMVSIAFSLWMEDDGRSFPFVARGGEKLILEPGDVVLRMSDRAPDCWRQTCTCSDFKDYPHGQRDMIVLVALGGPAPADRNEDTWRC